MSEKLLVTVNSLPIELALNSTLELLLSKQLTEDRRGIAVAVNEKVVPQAQWPSFALKSQDKILIITASQGG